MGRIVENSKDTLVYLRRLSYVSGGYPEQYLCVLEKALLSAAGGNYPFSVHQVRDGVTPLDALPGERPTYHPWLSWFFVTGKNGHQRVFCEDILLVARSL